MIEKLGDFKLGTSFLERSSGVWGTEYVYVVLYDASLCLSLSNVVRVYTLFVGRGE